MHISWTSWPQTMVRNEKDSRMMRRSSWGSREWEGTGAGAAEAAEAEADTRQMKPKTAACKIRLRLSLSLSLSSSLSPTAFSPPHLHFKKLCVKAHFTVMAGNGQLLPFGATLRAHCLPGPAWSGLGLGPGLAWEYSFGIQIPVRAAAVD